MSLLHRVFASGSGPVARVMPDPAGTGAGRIQQRLTQCPSRLPDLTQRHSVP